MDGEAKGVMLYVSGEEPGNIATAEEGGARAFKRKDRVKRQPGRRAPWLASQLLDRPDTFLLAQIGQ